MQILAGECNDFDVLIYGTCYIYENVYEKKNQD